MRTVLLTTDTPHHWYFAREVNEVFPWWAIFLEKTGCGRTYRWHSLESAQREYEESELLKDLGGSGMGDLAPVQAFASLNDDAGVKALGEIAPEVVVVFGTEWLKPSVVRVASRACLNLHGGDPERYRGLDSHLWAIYHEDWGSLVTTLHCVDAGLDTGDIVLQGQLPWCQCAGLHELRAVNTRVCVELVLVALNSLQKRDWLPGRCQRRRGRYYSFMPGELKDVCIRKFNNHVRKLG